MYVGMYVHVYAMQNAPQTGHREPNPLYPLPASSSKSFLLYTPILSDPISHVDPAPIILRSKRVRPLKNIFHALFLPTQLYTLT